MSDHHTPDELDRRLADLGDLRRPPRADARIDALLGAAPPVVGADDPTEAIVVPIAAPPARRRTGWVAAAAALAVLAGVGVAVAVAAGDEDPVSPASVSEPIDDGTTDDADGETDDAAGSDADGNAGGADDDSGDGDAAQAPGDEVSTFDPAEIEAFIEEQKAWIDCVKAEIEAAFADGVPPADRQVPLTDACGDGPSISGFFANGFGFCLEPADGDESCVYGPEGFESFDEVPWGDFDFDFPELPGFDDFPDFPEFGEFDDWDELSPDVDEWKDLLPDLGEWLPFEEACTTENDADGISVECRWPCAAGEDCDSVLGGSGSFFIDPGALPDSFPDLPDDFSFPDDLPKLDEWFDDFPWTEKEEADA
ncbi:MAG: hypothetical protein AAF548_18500 [Actinomycetota bacterium]